MTIELLPRELQRLLADFHRANLAGPASVERLIDLTRAEPVYVVTQPLAYSYHVASRDDDAWALALIEHPLLGWTVNVLHDTGHRLNACN